MSRYDFTNICENCPPGGDFLECLECNESLADGCFCAFDKDLEEMSVRCHNCGVTYVLNVDDLFDAYTEYYDLMEQEPELNEPYERKPQVKVPHIQCRHYNVPVEFKDGTTVYASSMHERDANEPGPDLGVYLDSGWSPAGMAYTIDWRDYGLPKRLDAAAFTIIDAFKKARDDDYWVEVGCIGGHGRTGTALACMAVLSGLGAKSAIKFIRKTYCENAIEGDEQMWFVEWFETFVFGGKIQELEWWDKKTQSYIPGDVHTFNDPLDWEAWSMKEFKRSTPVWAAERKESVWYSRLDFEAYEKAFKVAPTAEQIEEAIAWKIEEDEADRVAAEKKASKITVSAGVVSSDTGVVSSDIPGATRVDQLVSEDDPF